MRKYFILWISAVSLVGLILISIVNFKIQSSLSQRSNERTADVVFKEIQAAILENEKEIEDLKETLNETNIQKARAFALMIKANPAILNDSAMLDRIVAQLGVDEVHVTDETGLLLWGNIPGYIGFDFNTSEQTLPFLKILDDPTYELAQEPTMNGAANKLFQYIGVSRQDAPGIVQVGLMPERLETAMAEKSVNSVIKAYTMGNSGFVAAVDPATDALESYPDTALIGTPAKELGIDINKTGYFCKINEQEYYCVTSDIENLKVITFMPTSELYSDRNAAVGSAGILFLAIFVLQAFAIVRLIRETIIKSLKRIDAGIEKITEGDMDEKINAYKFPEFAVLSDGINAMVDKIGTNMKDAQKAAQAQSNLISQVNDAAGTINTYASNMSAVSKDISEGATTQASSVEEISAFCDTILSQVQVNSQNAKKASDISISSERKLEGGMEKLERMNEAMNEIDTSSRNISQVIKTVSDIAFQTNILALNASVEAARAGQHGKGFAVVATEVRNLAAKCAAAADDTTALIEKALATVSTGKAITEETSSAIEEIMQETKSGNTLIGEISKATEEQAESISEMAKGISQISDVIQHNVYSVESAEENALKLADEVQKLYAMVNSNSSAVSVP